MELTKMSPSRQLSICFVSPLTYPLLAQDSTIKHVGGAELQQAILAKALVRIGYSVSMICLDYGQEDGEVIDGVTVYRAYKQSAGLPGLRFFYPRMSSIFSCMKRANADIYYQRCSGMLTGVVAKHCRMNKKVSVFSGAHNNDFVAEIPKLTKIRDKFMYKYGLQNIKQIVVQNREQKTLLNENFSRDSIIVNNAYEPPPNATNDKNGYILWVSTMREFKRPHLFIELVKLLPQYNFKMIGGAGDRVIYDEIEAAAKALPNLNFCGFVPFTEIEAHYDEARVVINTSHTEGFPNAFLQSWARAIPTVAFYDCGARDTAGKEICDRVDSMSEMQVLVEALMEDDNLWQTRGKQAQSYVVDNHSTDSVIEQLDSIFVKLTS
jgi:glycosyltransferase involved in cell wall biosynthesis